MKTWNAPVMKELDVRLTASGITAGTSEKTGYLDSDSWVNGSYNTETHEWNTNINGDGVDDGCLSEKKNNIAES